MIGQSEDDDDEQDETKPATRGIAPVAAVAPGRQCADQRQDENHNQDGREHRFPRSTLRIQQTTRLLWSKFQSLLGGGSTLDGSGRQREPQRTLPWLPTDPIWPSKSLRQSVTNSSAFAGWRHVMAPALGGCGQVPTFRSVMSVVAIRGTQQGEGRLEVVCPTVNRRARAHASCNLRE